MLQILLLTRQHNREAFYCGEQELDEYLKKTARQHNEKGISRTFVLVDTEKSARILGFFTLAGCEIVTADLPPKYAKRYPNKAPTARLARLAVSVDRQRKGLGGIMMVEAMRRTLSVSENIGIIGFFVDAKNQGARQYYEQYDFIPLPETPLTLFLPLVTLVSAVEVLGK
ncbi:MAG: GNAT family N-acetyltransferase [Geopsychrobacter sp.]|nr:GNAT family N-acetyltransferase [Geopsychrobacter sp.]